MMVIPRMTFYYTGMTTIIKVTDTSMLHHPSLKITGKVMASNGYILLPTNPMRGKSL